MEINTMISKHEWAENLRNDPRLLLDLESVIGAIQKDALNHCKDIAESLRIKCNSSDSPGVCANIRASAIRDIIQQEIDNL